MSHSLDFVFTDNTIEGTVDFVGDKVTIVDTTDITFTQLRVLRRILIELKILWDIYGFTKIEIVAL